MSLKPFTGWESHWFDADMRSGANQGMMSGYKYTVQVYNNHNTLKHVWSHGNYCIK